jgi:hypothetical protein
LFKAARNSVFSKDFLKGIAMERNYFIKTQRRGREDIAPEVFYQWNGTY